MVQLLISLFGIAVVHRNMSLLEKIEVVSRSNLNLIFYFLLLPFGFNLFFKELGVYVTIYIGIFSVTLMLFHKIIEYFSQNTFEKLHLHVLQSLILQIKIGKSSSAAVKNVFLEFNSWEKTVFSGLNPALMFEPLKKIKGGVFQQDFYDELRWILAATSHVSAQLTEFRNALKLQKNLRRRSGQALAAVRAQAVVCVLIYIAFFIMSSYYFSLSVLAPSTLVSLMLFLTGQVMIFRMGGRIRWKT